MLAWSCWILLDCSKLLGKRSLWSTVCSNWSKCFSVWPASSETWVSKTKISRYPRFNSYHFQLRYQVSIKSSSAFSAFGLHKNSFQLESIVNRPVCQWTPATSYWSPASMTTYFFPLQPCHSLSLCRQVNISRLVKSCSWPAKHPWQLGSWPDIVVSSDRLTRFTIASWSIDVYWFLHHCCATLLPCTEPDWTCSSLILWQRQRSAWVSLSILASCVSRRWVVSDIILAHQCSLRSFPLARNDAFHTNGPSQKCLRNDSIVNSHSTMAPCTCEVPTRPNCTHTWK